VFGRHAKNATRERGGQRSVTTVVGLSVHLFSLSCFRYAACHFSFILPFLEFFRPVGFFVGTIGWFAGYNQQLQLLAQKVKYHCLPFWLQWFNRLFGKEIYQ
jgi:hypothetical protein